VDGSAFAAYNLGLIDQRVGSSEHKLNDNVFHVLRLFRSGANVSLQIDDLPATKKQPTGSSLELGYHGFMYCRLRYLSLSLSVYHSQQHLNSTSTNRISNSTLCPRKKGATKLMAVTSSNLNRCSKFFYHWKENCISNKTHVVLSRVSAEVSALISASEFIKGHEAEMIDAVQA